MNTTARPRTPPVEDVSLLWLDSSSSSGAVRYASIPDGRATRYTLNGRCQKIVPRTPLGLVDEEDAAYEAEAAAELEFSDESMGDEKSHAK